MLFSTSLALMPASLGQLALEQLALEQLALGSMRECWSGGEREEKSDSDEEDEDCVSEDEKRDEDEDDVGRVEVEKRFAEACCWAVGKASKVVEVRSEWQEDISEIELRKSMKSCWLSCSCPGGKGPRTKSSTAPRPVCVLSGERGEGLRGFRSRPSVGFGSEGREG